MPDPIVGEEQVVVQQNGLEIADGKDPYTWVDEITNNVLKIIGFSWLLAGFSYCVLYLDIDKNLIYGFFAGALPSVLALYVLQRRKKEENGQ